MNNRQQRIHDQFGEYRGHCFLTEARQEGEVWTGHFRLLCLAGELAHEAVASARHRWMPLEPGWATENEAETNAVEAAHAAIDAVLSIAPQRS